MKPKKVSKIEQIVLTSCLEMEKKIQPFIFYIQRVDPMVFSFNKKG